MSKPTRYSVADNQAQLTLGGNILVVDPAGPLVEYADYARLKAENERLRHFELVASSVDFYQNENARLKAEVERLRKAGDAMAHTIEMISIYGFEQEDVQTWNAAKEGKQS